MSPLSLASPASANLQTPGLIALTPYEAVSDIGLTSTNTSADGADFDATNLAVSFTVPPSGTVIVRLSGALSMAGATNGYWNIREGTTKIKEALIKDTSGIITGSRSFRISGLTPGVVKTYKWGARVSSGTTTLYTGPTFGPATIEVWDANPSFSQMAMLAIANVLTPSLIATTSYNPASQAAPAAVSTSYVDIDATNLVVNFVTPPSGKVLIRLTARASCGLNNELSWNLRNASGDISGTVAVIVYGSSSDVGPRITHTAIISGLTPGSAQSFKWGHARSYGSGATQTLYGGSAGPAIMEVWDANVTYSQQLTISGVRPFKFVNYQSASALSTSSTSYVDTGIPDIVLSAQTGDVIEFGVNLLVSNSGGSNLSAIDIVTVSAGAAANATPINSFAASAIDGAYRTQNPTAGIMGLVTGSVMYTLVAGDISSSGTVTVRTRFKVNTGTMSITCDNPNRRAHTWAKNLGQAAA